MAAVRVGWLTGGRGSTYATTKLPALVTEPTGAALFVTVIIPVLAPDGTTALSVVAETYVTLVAATPWKPTAEPGVNPTPLIVTVAPTAARPGEEPVTESEGVNLIELEAALTGDVVIEIVAAAAPFGTVASICVEESTLNVAVSLSLIHI